MKWESKKLEAVADFCLGKMLDQKKNRGGPLPYLANVNVRWGEFDLADLREMRFEQHELERYGLRYGDIVMCEGGEPGRCAIWKDQRSSMMIQKALHRIRPHDCLRPEFLYYFFLYKGRTGNLSPLFTGSTIKHLPREKLALVEVPVPAPSIQDYVASILSAYDDLIENNRRRLQLLEQAARLLYKEWFVHLRFPGHEHAKIIDGVPEGWERRTLEDLCEHISYGYTASANENDVGPKFLRITDIVPEMIDWGSVPHCEIEERKLQKFLLHEGDVVIARTGATVGYGKRIGPRAPAAVFASYLVRFRFGPQFDNILGGIFMESDYYKAYVQSNIGGAAQPNANARILGGAKILVPPITLQRLFRENAEPIFDQRNALQEQNQKLAQARDLLLPKLMNGEIAV